MGGHENGVQVAILISALVTLPIWVAVGRLNQRVGWNAAIPVLLSLATSVYYSLVLFTDANNVNEELFVLLSSWLRFYVQDMLLVGGLLMLRAVLRRRMKTA